MRTSDSQVEITKALVAFKLENVTIIKGSTNPHFGSAFADLADIKDPTDPALAKHGLVLVQHPETVDGVQCLTSRLMHVSGEWQESTMELYVPKADAQSMGSALTYGKRQSFTAISGVAPKGEDDDGQAATDHGPVTRTTRSTGMQPGSQAAKAGNPASEAQWKYLAKLTNQTVEQAHAQYGSMNAAACSSLIDGLKEAA